MVLTGRTVLSAGLSAWLGLFTVRPVPKKGTRKMFDKTKARLRQPVEQVANLAVLALIVAGFALGFALIGFFREPVTANAV